MRYGEIVGVKLLEELSYYSVKLNTVEKNSTVRRPSRASPISGRRS